TGTGPFTLDDVITTIVLISIVAAALIGFYLLWLPCRTTRWRVMMAAAVVLLWVADVVLATSARAGASSQSTTGVVLAAVGAGLVIAGAIRSRYLRPARRRRSGLVERNNLGGQLPIRRRIGD